MGVGRGRMVSVEDCGKENSEGWKYCGVPSYLFWGMKCLVSLFSELCLYMLPYLALDISSLYIIRIQSDLLKVPCVVIGQNLLRVTSFTLKKMN